MDLSRSEIELESIVRRIRDNELDLQPDFQRGEIWDRKRQQRLIDSLLRDWYVPAIHIVRNEGGGSDEVLDGQQRLAAIRGFFDDEFVVDGNTEPASSEIRALDGLRFSELPDHMRRRLQRFALPFVTLRNYEPQEPNELFFRLNQSYNLTPPEKRNALHGPARKQVKDIVFELSANGLLIQEVVGFSNGRLAYDDIVSRACLAVERGDLKQHINNNSVERFYREQQFSDLTVQSIVESGHQMLELLGDVELKLRFNKASLFTWLVFCAWSPRVLGVGLPSQFLADFESHRRSLKRNDITGVLPPELESAVNLYDDRASYRVTDVSSVLARDCVLYLFLQREYGARPLLGSDRLLETLRGGRSETADHQQILEFVSETAWGRISEYESITP